MLFNLQVLRGVAALSVVFFHTDYRLMGDWHTEFFGVATFFVISGFIMCLVTRNNADGFLRKRLERIVPLYWLCTVALILVMFQLATFEPSTWLSPLEGRPGEALWAYVARGLMFLPLEDKYPILNVGWSLHFELYFYLLFAAALWINRRAAPLLVIASLVALSYVNTTICKAPVCHYLSTDYTQFFIAGIALFYIVDRFRPATPRPLLVWIGAVLITVCYGSQFVGPWWSSAIAPSVYVAFATLAPIIIVGSALMVEHAGGALTWWPLIVVGDSSYAIYLTHSILFEMVSAGRIPWLALPQPNGSVVMTVAFVTLAGVIGVVVHLFIEKPLLRALRRGSGAGKVETSNLKQA